VERNRATKRKRTWGNKLKNYKIRLMEVREKNWNSNYFWDGGVLPLGLALWPFA
jgi:hypothetical protein